MVESLNLAGRAGRWSAVALPGALRWSIRLELPRVAGVPVLR